MGAAMAGILLEAEHELVVHNRTRTKAEQLISYGARVADSPSELAEVSDIIITMLPGPPEVEEVVAGEGGLLEGAAEGSLIVDMSTSSPLLARQLASMARERGVRMLDGPVSGGLASNRVLEVKGEKFLSHEFTPGGKVEYHRKDLGIALAAGREYGVTLPVTALVDQMFEVLETKGRGSWDHSALLTLIEEGSR